jgi:hypothetical protein
MLRILGSITNWQSGLNPKLTEATRFHSQIFEKKFSLIEQELERDFR